jgi:hypothetical protein
MTVMPAATYGLATYAPGTSTAKASRSSCRTPEDPPDVLDRGYAELSRAIIVDFLITSPVVTIAPVPRPGESRMPTMPIAWSMPELDRRARIPALR